MFNTMFASLCLNTSDVREYPVMWNRLKKDVVASNICLLSFEKESKKSKDYRKSTCERGAIWKTKAKKTVQQREVKGCTLSYTSYYSSLTLIMA